MDTGQDSSGAAAAARLWPLTLALIVALTIIIAGGALFYREQERSLRERARNELEAVATLKTSQIETWRTDRLADASRLSTSPSVRAFVMTWLDDRGPRHTEEVKQLLRSLQFDGRYSNVLLVDTDGRVLVAANDTMLTQLNPSVRELLSSILERRSAALTELHKSTSDPDVHIDVLVPLYNGGTESSRPIAAIVLQVRAADYLFPLIQRWPTASTSAETLLVRRDGDDALFLNEVRHVDGAALSRRVPLSKTDVPAVQAINGHVGFFEGTDYRGEPVLSYVAPIKDSPWFMVAKVDTQEALAGWRARSRLIAALVAACVVLALVAYFIARERIRGQRLKEVVHAQSAKIRAQERLRATLASVGDAVISTDLECRIEFMNQVAEDLTGWTLDEALGRQLDEVFVIVNEDTRDTVDNPATCAIQECRVVGLANHTILIARDGIERPIADSAAPITDEYRQIIGVVLVFRDQTAAHEARHALELSERRHRLLFENMIDGFALHEMVFDDHGRPIDYRFLQVNRAFELMTGLRAEEIVGRTVREVLPNTESLWIERYGEVVRTGEPQEFEEYTVSTGHYYRVMAYSPDEEQFACVIVDVTERVRAEQVAAVRLRLHEAAPTCTTSELMVMVLDEVGALLDSPIGFFHSYDESTQQLSLQAWSTSTLAGFCQAVVDEQHHGLEDAGVWADCIRERRPVVHNDYQHMENRRGMPAGHAVLRREVVVPIMRAGRIEAVLGVGNRPHPYVDADVAALVQLGDVAWEVVQRRRAESAMREAERQVLTLSDNIPDGYIYQLSVDADSGNRRMLHISAGVERVHGLTPAQILEDASLLYGQTHEEDQPALDAEEEAALREMRPFRARVRVNALDGGTKWLRIASVPRTTPNGRVIWDGLTIDVTDRVLAEQELKERTDELVRSNAELEKFAYIASHDLQEPLRMVASYTQLLKRRYAGQLDADADEFIDFAVDGATRMQDLINELLAYSRVGTQGAPFSKTDTGRVVGGVLKVLGLQLDDMDASIEVGEMPTVLCDATQIGQVFQNLLSNAIKFRSERPLHVIVKAEDVGGEWVFSVSDNGMGIEERYFERIFVIFQRLEDRSEYPGTGMGLAICKRIIERHGGRIWVESEPGVGSTFKFTLPQSTEEPNEG